MIVPMNTNTEVQTETTVSLVPWLRGRESPTCIIHHTTPCWIGSAHNQWNPQRIQIQDVEVKQSYVANPMHLLPHSSHAGERLRNSHAGWRIKKRNQKASHQVPHINTFKYILSRGENHLRHVLHLWVLLNLCLKSHIFFETSKCSSFFAMDKLRNSL